MYVGQAGVQVDADLAAALEQLLFAEPLFQPFPAAAKRLVDGFGRRCEPALQDGQGEADRALAALVLQGLGPVELLADVVGDSLVEVGFGVGQVVADGVGMPLGEQRRAVELEQLLLDQPAHQVGGIDGVDAVAELALEAVAVEQRHEKLEVLLLAVVRRGRHQQEVPGDAGRAVGRAGSAWWT